MLNLVGLFGHVVTYGHTLFSVVNRLVIMVQGSITVARW